MTMRPFEWLYSGLTTRSPLHPEIASAAVTATRGATVVRMATVFATSAPYQWLAISRSWGHLSPPVCGSSIGRDRCDRAERCTSSAVQVREPRSEMRGLEAAAVGCFSDLLDRVRGGFARGYERRSLVERHRGPCRDRLLIGVVHRGEGFFGEHLALHQLVDVGRVLRALGRHV